jgi:hypothetical protein
LVALLGVLLLWQLSARSTIPTAVHGTVVSVRSADEHPGTDNAWFVRVGDRTHQVDREVGQLLRVGDRVDKKAWDDSLLINSLATDVRYSDDARAARWFVPVLVAVAVALSWFCARLSRRRVS